MALSSTGLDVHASEVIHNAAKASSCVSASGMRELDICCEAAKEVLQKGFQTLLREMDGCPHPHIKKLRWNSCECGAEENQRLCRVDADFDRVGEEMHNDWWSINLVDSFFPQPKARQPLFSMKHSP